MRTFALLPIVFSIVCTSPSFAQDCTANAGRDTLICGFSYTLTNNNPIGYWDIDCNNSEGFVDFFTINDSLTSATVNTCGTYNFIYSILDTLSVTVIDTMIVEGNEVVDTLIQIDTLCYSTDTVRILFQDPGSATFDLLSSITIAFLEEDCIQNDTINCGNRISNENGPPDPLWTFINTGVCQSTIINTEVIGDSACVADQIAFSSMSSIGTFADTFTIYQSEFLVQDPVTGEIITNNYGSVLAEVNSSIFESAADQCPIPAYCPITLPYCLDTIPDTSRTILPIRLTGEWTFYSDIDSPPIILEDTTQFVKDDSTFIIIAQPSATDFEATFDFFQIDYLGDTIPTVGLDTINFEWEEIWGMDTTISIGIKIVDTCCTNFIRVNQTELNELQVPVYDCPPFSVVFLEDLEGNVTIPSCDSGFYHIIVEITGGRAPYSVDGLDGSIEGNIFTSVNIPIDEGYNITLSDQDGCSKPLAGDACYCIGVQANSISEAGLFCGQPCTTLIGQSDIEEGDEVETLWTNNEGTYLSFGDSAVVCQAGTYIYEVRDPVSGCVTRSFTHVEEREIIADAGPDTTLNCYNREIRLGGPEMSLGSDLIYIWNGPGIDSTNSNQPFPIIDESGTYTLTILLEGFDCGAADIVIVNSNFSQPIAEAGIDKYLPCTAGQTVTIGGLSTLGVAFIYEWTGPGINDSNRNERKPNVSVAGEYTIRVINTTNGCFKEDTVEVFAYEPISFVAEVLSNSCYNAPMGRIRFSEITGGRPPYSYSWSGTFYTGSNPLENVPSGIHQVMIRDFNGCKFSQEVEITRIPAIVIDLPDEFHYCIDKEVEIDATQDVEIENLYYRWSNGSSQSMTTYTNIIGENWVEITSPCETIIETFVLIDDSDIDLNISKNLVMPNAFTPDGDNANETFGPILGEIDLLDYEFTIYNRWGQKVFESTDPEITWDGILNGRNAPEDVYIWVLNTNVLICDGLEEPVSLKGEVVLIR